MKTKIVLYTLLFFCTAVGFAQEVVVPIEQRKGYNDQLNTKYYYKDVNGVLDKFVGTWKYENNNEVFEITFIKKIHQNHGGDYKDKLASKFKYIKNGVVIYNTYPKSRTNYIYGGFFLFPNNTNKIRLQYFEPGVTYRTIQSQLDLEYIPSTTLAAPTQLYWKQNVIVDNPDPTPYKLPYIMTLIKQ